MADKMGNPFQLLSLRLVGMWSFSRLEMQQEAMTAWRFASSGSVSQHNFNLPVHM
jgi:hypothetical protein